MTAIRSAPSPLVFEGRSALIRSNSTVIRASLSSTWGSMGETVGGGRLVDVCGPARRGMMLLIIIILNIVKLLVAFYSSAGKLLTSGHFIKLAILWQWPYPDNSPSGQFPTVQVLVLMSALFGGNGPSGELSWWGILLGIVFLVGNDGKLS